MKQSDNFIVFQQTGPLRTWLAEIADQCGRRVSACAVFVCEAWADVEVGSMSVPEAIIQSIESSINFRNAEHTSHPADVSRCTGNQQTRYPRPHYSKR